MYGIQHKLNYKAFVFALFLFLLASVAGTAIQVSTTAAAGDPVIVAAGDIACDPADPFFNAGKGTSLECRQLATYNLIASTAPVGVLPLGDDQYYCGGYNAFLDSYALSWGKVKSITHPVVGNHEYLTQPSSSGYGTDCNSSNTGAAGYFKYYGAAAGDPKKGYYSYNIGAWHLIALNTQCSQVGGCGSGSPQESWLRSDLGAHKGQCVLAYWHIPRWSSGGRASSNSATFITDLYNAGADVVLTGHDHDYERFAPQNPSGVLDTVKGIREFVVGTGGSNHTSFTTTAANSLIRNSTTFGVLKMTLDQTSYDWQFLPEAGKTFTDSGSAACHNASAASSTPTRTATSAATATRTNTPTNTPIGAPSLTPTFTPTATGAATPTATATGSTATMTFTPAADAYVDSSNPSANFGTSTQLRVDGSPIVNSYLRFSVSGLSGTVKKATLRIFANSSLTAGYTVHAVSNNTWGETSLTFSNAPAMGSTIGSSGAITAGTWTTVDVTAYVTGIGAFSFGLTDSSATALSLASRESGANAPQLILQTGP